MFTGSHFVVSFIVVTLSAAAVFAQGQTPTAAGARSAPDTLRLLNQVIPEVSIDAQPFESVLAWLAEFTQINFNVRWNWPPRSVLWLRGARSIPVISQRRGIG